MKQIDKDRAELKRLVESYGKKDVLKFITEGLGDSLFPARLQLVPSEKVETIYYVADEDGNTEATRDENEFNTWLERGQFRTTEIYDAIGPSSLGRKVWKNISAAKVKTITTRVDVEDVEL